MEESLHNLPQLIVYKCHAFLSSYVNLVIKKQHCQLTLCVSVSAPDMMDPIRTVKPKDSRTLMADFNPKTGATSYVIRVENTNGFFREDSVSSSPAEIKYLNPYTEYQLSIMAVNDAGRSQPSSHVAEKTRRTFFTVLLLWLLLETKYK